MDNTVKFTGKADIYAKYRPSYPDALLDYLITAGGLPESAHVADIGAGTGKLSERLLAGSLRVTAVEPNDDMRGEAEKWLGARNGYQSVSGTAEHTGLPDGTVDLVTVAQAFHWFDPIAFKAECRRILKPGAQVALIWNTSGQETALHADVKELFQKLHPESDETAPSGTDHTPVSTLESFYENGTFETTDFPNDRTLTLEAFIGFNLSKSYSPQRGDASYGAFAEELTALFHKHSRNGTLVLHEVTRCNLGRV